MSSPCRSNFASGSRFIDEDGTNALAIRLPYGKSRSVLCVKGPEKQSAVSHMDGGVVVTSTTSWVEGLLVEGLLVAAGHGGVVRRRHERCCSLPSTLSTFPRGPRVPCLARRVLGSFSCFALFLRTKRSGLLVIQWLVFFLRLTYSIYADL